MRTRTLIVIALCLAAQLNASSCVAQRAPAGTMQDAFAELGMLTNYLEFPHNPATLDRCFKEKDRRCLQLYGSARRAAAALFDQGPQVALDRTLDGIAAQCREPRSDWQAKGWLSGWQSCTGAAAALYFFATDTEDQQIVQFLTRLDDKVLFNMLVESYGYAEAWVGNRPDRKRWIALIDARPVLDRAADRRDGYKKLFQTATATESRIALIDPRFKLNADQVKGLERTLR